MTCLIATLPILAGTGQAMALPHSVPIPGRYDGPWSVGIVTEAGFRDRAYRYPIRIEHGVARFLGTA